MENRDARTHSSVSRRDALKLSGAAAGAMALFSALSEATAGAATTSWTQSDYVKFAKLVNKCWEDAHVLKEYNADPAAVLSQYGLTLPSGTAAPVIPTKPHGTLGKEGTAGTAWEKQVVTDFANWDVSVSSTSGTTGGFTIGCIACPVSSISSWSNKD